MKSVQIQNPDMAWHIAANILFPPDFDEAKTYPTIVSVHPFGSCKEQTSGNVYGADGAINVFLPPSVDAARSAGITDIDVLEATDYYRNRFPAEGAGTRMLVSHAAPAMAWDAFAFAERLLTQPMMIVIGDEPGGFGAYRDGMEIYGRAPSEDKQLVVVEGWSHYDLYDQPEPVGIALARVIPFLKQHLGG